MEGHRKFVGAGVLKGKILEAKYEAKLEFLGGRGVRNKKSFRGGSMGIFWNYTLCDTLKLLITLLVYGISLNVHHHVL